MIPFLTPHKKSCTVDYIVFFYVILFSYAMLIRIMIRIERLIQQGNPK